MFVLCSPAEFLTNNPHNLKQSVIVKETLMSFFKLQQDQDIYPEVLTKLLIVQVRIECRKAVDYRQQNEAGAAGDHLPTEARQRRERLPRQVVADRPLVLYGVKNTEVSLLGPQGRHRQPKLLPVPDLQKHPV